MPPAGLRNACPSSPYTEGGRRPAPSRRLPRGRRLGGGLFNNSLRHGGETGGSERPRLSKVSLRASRSSRFFRTVRGAVQYDRARARASACSHAVRLPSENVRDPLLVEINVVLAVLRSARAALLSCTPPASPPKCRGRRSWRVLCRASTMRLLCTAARRAAGAHERASRPLARLLTRLTRRRVYRWRCVAVSRKTLVGSVTFSCLTLCVHAPRPLPAARLVQKPQPQPAELWRAAARPVSMRRSRRVGAETETWLAVWAADARS